MNSRLYDKRLLKLQQDAIKVPITKESKIVIMSDCHRGCGGWNDNFAPNAKIYFAALRNYYERGFTYIELGDGDELWEEKDYRKIICQYSNIFWLLSQFHQEDRLYLIYGNHDMNKRNSKYVDKYLSQYFCDSKSETVPLLENVKVEESILLEDMEHMRDILLIHGHQGDLLNSKLWFLSRWMVRYLWKPLEFMGTNNPFTPNQNNYRNDKKETPIKSWAQTYQQYVIMGHTHKPEHPKNKGYYYNTGSCVHPRCITAIEIEDANIALVKWCIEADENMSLYIKREVLERET